MDDALRLLLATLFAWAGIAKLVTFARFRFTLGRHGVPRPLRGPITGVVAGLEIGTAVWLGSGRATSSAGITAATISALFAAAMVRARIQGRRSDACGYFGSARSAGTIVLSVRATVIAALGVAVAIGIGGSGAAPTETLRSAALTVLGVLVLGLSLAVVARSRAMGSMAPGGTHQTPLERMAEGPDAGEIAPMLLDLRRMGPEMVAFVVLNSRECIDVLPGLRGIDRDGIPVHWIREDAEPEVFAEWGVPDTPYVVYLVDGVVRSKGRVTTLEQVRWLIDAGAERGADAA